MPQKKDQGGGVMIYRGHGPVQVTLAHVTVHE